MSQAKLYALLVGINDYSHRMPALKGCVNDVKNVTDYLNNHMQHLEPAIHTLTDHRATRRNIIDGFRTHLTNAGSHDVVLFYFSGHGSRVRAPEGFQVYEPDGMHETIVCVDSRNEGQWDLADKELAALLAEVGKKGPHMLAILDCCHSASGVREIKKGDETRVRYTGENPNSRPLATYLDGYFIRHELKAPGLKVPGAKMALLAACDKREQAREDNRHKGGIFTTHLFKILREGGRDISYGDLFLRTRQAVLDRTRIQMWIQTPQLECLKDFNPYGLFLDGRPGADARRYRVGIKNNTWFINCGAVHGIPNLSLNHIEFAVYAGSRAGENEQTFHARARRVGLRESEIEMEEGHTLDRDKEYPAGPLTLPLPPLHVYISGEPAGTAQIERVCNEEKIPMIRLVHQPGDADIEVQCIDGGYRIRDGAARRTFAEIKNDSEESTRHLLGRLERVLRGKRILEMRNTDSRLNQKDIDFTFYRLTADGSEVKHDAADITLTSAHCIQPEGWVPFRLKLIKRNGHKWFFTLLHISPDYGISTLRPCEYIPQTSGEVILFDGSALYLPNGDVRYAVDSFLLIVSTQKLDDHLFLQAGVTDPQEYKDIVIQQPIDGDWFRKRFRVTTRREEDKQ